MKRVFKILAVAGICAAVLVPGNASASTITFSGLTGSDVPFITYSEVGFTVNVTAGLWGHGQFEGDPIPSIFAGPGFDSGFTGQVISSFTVAQIGGGPFTFDDLNLAANGTDVHHEFLGTLNGANVFDTKGEDNDPTHVANFLTIGSGDPSDPIDTLTIAANVANEGNGTVNIDNIAVSAVPEPSTIALFAIGLGLFAPLLRKRRLTMIG
jgi:hypothetical protein